MRSVMKHQFSQVPSVNIPRSSFDRSHGYKTTFDAGKLVPFLVDEVLPGDSFNVNLAAFARMATPTFPIMDNMYMDTQFFFIPLRLVWDNFQKFMGEQDNPADSIDYLIPTTTTTGFSINSLYDYMGCPTSIAGLEVNNLFARAYHRVWNEWYRDENLQDSVTVDMDDGPDTDTDYATLLSRGKRHDYFTSCLPWPQKGESVEVPLGDRAPVLGIGTDDNTYIGGSKAVRESNGQANTYFNYQNVVGTPGNWWVEQNTTTADYPGIYADLSSATASTINELRMSFQIQKLLERDARGGTRYTELVKSHFGVTSPDARLQRTEYLGGGSTPISINPVLATASTTTEVGDTAAYATASISNHGFTKSFTEHGIVLGLVSVRADLTYQQGLNRMFSRSTRYDMYWPSLSHIGEQAVLNKEIYAQGTAGGTDDDDVFGYQERYAEFRYKPSLITSAFRSAYITTLDAWHLSQEFSSLPELNTAFITENPPIDRVVNTPDEPHFIFDSYIQMRCARPMPLYGVPGMIDHF